MTGAAGVGAATSAGATLAAPIAAVATPAVATAPVITVIEGSPVPTAPSPVTGDPVADTSAPATAGDAPALAPADDDASAGTSTPDAEAASNAPAPIAPIAMPVDIDPVATPDAGQDPATSQTALAAAVHAAGTTNDTVADTTIDTDARHRQLDTTIETDTAIDTVADTDSSIDTATQPAFAIQSPATRHDDASPTSSGGPAPVIEAADDLAVPLRMAPPRTIAVDLNDEGLGPLRVIATSEQRTVHLTVSASEAVVRDALVRQQSDLRNDLADAGLQLGSFEVDSRAADRDQANQPTTTGDRDRQSARSSGALAAAAPIPSTHDADGRLDLRL